MRDPDLWDRLVCYDFAMSGQLPKLTEQVQKKLRLNAVNAKIAEMEYRRFLYLAAIADEVVAPAPVIDAIWHLHLLDTRAYLDGLCAQVIGRVIHHTPGRDRQADDAAYPKTLALYQKEFGVAPSPRVWPRVAVLKAGRYAGLPVVLGLVVMLYGVLEGGLGFGMVGFVMVSVPLGVWMAVGPWSAGGNGRESDAGSDGGPDGGDGCGGD